ncbi:hypothetical protein CEP54_016272 [Fusarium duplospermum]|uniref:Uncharacterized protein n=1 Tax=Fusarium duplospermum TaxID=1325734 RepID=A0A428NFZ9_9HYPO|nr:hypothetical protein CEP54_016272 [Fusarium duplospermum]
MLNPRESLEGFGTEPHTLLHAGIAGWQQANIGVDVAHDIIPRKGAIRRFLNPHPWNRKEHTASVLMASAASVSALSTEALSVQKLWYGGYANQAAGIFITLFSQLIVYGIAGMMRTALLYPTKMLYPANLPITTVFSIGYPDFN